MKVRIGLVVVVVAALLGVAAPSFAASVTCGMNVTHNLKLRRNLRCSSGNGLNVQASNLTINLNHHTISTSDTGIGAGVQVSDFFGVSVTNGKIKGFDAGVGYDGVIGGTISKLKLTNNRHNIRLSESGDITITRNRTSGGDNGILTTGGSTGLTITNNKLHPGVGSGIRLNGTEFSVVSHNTIRNGHDRAIYLLNSANNNDIFANRIETTTNAGIELDDSFTNLVQSNSIKHAGTGIDLEAAAAGASHSNTLQSNAVSASTNDGIQAGANTTSTFLDDNTSNSNGVDGIDIQSSNADLRGNTANHNGNDGIVTTAGDTDEGGNTATRNAVANCTGPVAC